MLLNFMWPFLSPDASDSFEVDLIYVHHSPKEIPSSTILFNIISAHSALMYHTVTVDFMNNLMFKSTQPSSLHARHFESPF